MDKKANRLAEPIYLGIQDGRFGPSRKVYCAACEAAERKAVGPVQSLIIPTPEKGIPVLCLTVSDVTWSGQCPECGQRYWADWAGKGKWDTQR